MKGSVILLICALVVLFNSCIPTLGQSTPSYSYNIVADLTAPEDWINGTYTNVRFPSDDSVVPLRLGFTFQFFEYNYTSVTISSNANIQVDTAGTAYITSALPNTQNLYLPFGGFFFTDMNPVHASSGPVLYRTEGEAPSRCFILRFQNVSTATVTKRLFAEIVLFENSTMAWRYYIVPTTVTNVVVGVQGHSLLSDQSYDYTAVWNNLPMNASLVELLQGKTIYWSAPPFAYAEPITFSPNTTDEYEITFIESVVELDIGTATWSNIPASDEASDVLNIGFPFIFYNVQFENISMSSNGNLRLGAVTQQTPTGQPMPEGNPNRVPLIAAFWADLLPGARTLLQYTTFGEVGSRQFVARWSNITYFSATSTYLSFDVLLHETTNQIEVRYYAIDRHISTILIGIQNQTSAQADRPGFGYLVNAERIDVNNLYMTLNRSTLFFTPTGVPHQPSSTGAVATESSSSGDLFQSSSSSTEIPIESSASSVVSIESSSSSGGIGESSSIIVIPTGCSFSGNIEPGTLVVEVLVNRDIDSLGVSFGPTFINAISSFFGSSRPNTLFPTFGCISVVGFGNRIGNLAPTNENESVVRLLIIPNSGSGNENVTIITPEEASQNLNDSSLGLQLSQAGLPAIVQTAIAGQLCPDGSGIPIDDSCDGDDGDDDDLTDGELAGIIVGSVIGGLLLIGLCICLLVSSRRRKTSSNTDKVINNRAKEVQMGEHNRTEAV